MKQALYYLVYRIADIHEAILQLNNDYEANLTDKQLHFLVIGFLGLILYLIVTPIFRYLAEKRCIPLVSWLYSFTVIIGITFAIEIGQHFTNTGNMEFADIVYGVVGFLVLGLLWALIQGIRWVVKLIWSRGKDSFTVL